MVACSILESKAEINGSYIQPCERKDNINYEEEYTRELIPRPYQQELFECAMKKNSILVLGTGSGKTFISIMLIKQFGDQIRGALSKGAKRTVFIVNTVQLVDQQADEIERHTSFKVGKFKGAMGVAAWDANKLKNELDKYEVLVIVAEIFNKLIKRNKLNFNNINLLIMDECHHATGDHPMMKIMLQYGKWKSMQIKNRQRVLLPKILGLTACVINRKCPVNKVKALIKDLELTMDSTIVTSIYQDIVKFHSTKPQEIIVLFDKFQQCFISEMLALFFPLLTIEETLNQFFGRVKKLISLLITYGERQDPVRILVFAETRNRAKFLHAFLLKLRNERELSALQYLNPGSIVGEASNMKEDINFNLPIENSKNTLSKFREGDCNLIFCTSVLEEGIHVEKCNVVIRFDKPPHFCSYIQSLGRARAVPSDFILLSEESYDSNDLQSDLHSYKEICKCLLQFCHERRLKSYDDMNKVADDLPVEQANLHPCFPDNNLTFDSVFDVVNEYCASLPMDKFTKPQLSVQVTHVEGGIKASIKLPRNAPLKDIVYGKVSSNEEDAKKSAALTLCKELGKIKELNENLLPKKIKLNIPLKSKVSIVTGKDEVNNPQPGTRKKRQVYNRQICQHFQSYIGMKHLYLHYIDFGAGNSFFESKQRIGILCAERITCSKFPLYNNESEKVVVEIKFLHEISLNEVETINHIKNFHIFVFQFLLKNGNGWLTLNLEDAYNSLLLVPLTSDPAIDLVFLKKFSNLHLLKHDHPPASTEETFQFLENVYKDAIIIPVNSRNHKLFIVEEVLFNMNPLSQFPNGKMSNTFKSHFRSLCCLEIKNDKQPLLRCKSFPKESSYFKIKRNSFDSSPSTSDHSIFIPELCKVFPFKYSFWSQIVVIPSILHRINGLLLERELYESVQYFAKPEEEHNFYIKSLDFHWNEHEIKKSINNNRNLAVTLNTKTELSIYPGMILQSLTPVKAEDNFNLERFELLGDSFLKYIVSVHLFCRELNHHEGELTIEKSRIVSNENLYLMAQNKKIPELFQGFMSNKPSIIPYGFQFKEDLELLLRTEKIDPQCWITYFHKANKNKVPRCEQVFHPWNEQVINDKSIADCTESLIGIYFLIGGEKAAKHLLIWLGFHFLEEDFAPPITADIKVGVTQDMVNCFFKKHCLDELEGILQYEFRDKSFLIEAVTHPSDCQNLITDCCYQRLEFLGDAILDILMTGHIYSEFRQYDPGQLTDLRSYFVNNETLAHCAVEHGLHKYLQHGAPTLTACIDTFIDLHHEGKTELSTESDASYSEDVDVPKALGDIVESIIGAIYLDSNQSLEMCWKVIQILLAKEFIKTKASIPINHVKRFYEVIAKMGLEYEVMNHSPTEEELAMCVIKIAGHDDIVGYGKNKRIAKKDVAKKFLSKYDVVH